MGSLLIDEKPHHFPFAILMTSWVLASAIDGQADLLVTEDQYLLAIADGRLSPSSIHAAAGIASANSDASLRAKGIRPITFH